MPINIHSIVQVNAQRSSRLLEWLEHQASLTDKLKQTNGDAQLELLSQNWVNADWWDKNVLQIQDERVFCREIMMKSHGIPYWYAMSIIPQQCYDLDPSFFDRLKNESIKNLIFDENRVQRTHSLSYPLDNQCIEFYWVQKHIPSVAGILWARLAEFVFQEKESFYLIELILPEIETFIS
ncbi:MAG: chorismate--pyruvate lyase family protein [Legionella sp.]